MKNSYVEYYDQKMRMNGINMINKGKGLDKFLKKGDGGKWYKFDKNNNYKSVGYYLTNKVCSEFLTDKKMEIIEKIIIFKNLKK